MTRVDPEFPPSYAPEVETIAAGCAWGIVPRRAATRDVFCFVVAVGAGGGVAIGKRRFSGVLREFVAVLFCVLAKLAASFCAALLMPVIYPYYPGS